MEIVKEQQLVKEGGQQLVIKMKTNEIVSKNEGELTVDKSAVYCIQVVGYLDSKWSNRLGGLEISATSQQGMPAVTTLSGSILDQAALFGVLKALYDMRMPLISVECLEIN